MNSILHMIWFLFGVAMLVCGVVSMVTPMETFFALMVLIPMILIAGGIVGLFYYYGMQKSINSQWILGDSLLSLLFGLIFALGGIDFTSVVMVYFVAFLAIFKGIIGVISSFELKKLGFSQWLWLCVIAALNIFIGAIFIIKPSIASIAIGVLAGIYFVFFGLITLMGWWGAKNSDPTA
ncbi:hypothetical protein BKH46_00740 [Helicobacter sp. 12S02634-8]|uniref:HdeD family acid-resistance protein n=1 Tax=Helicobacter sp. 12S02634-8 TaxID=1476199 RepID=UPI000BA5A084|nr:DUF308 domain-containing protein [Helicobacter sp. 12S02634-8]PAF48472.1 hypothetical protein BKH46_00740 [Helicobacter sp. 12S02634-8]